LNNITSILTSARLYLREFVSADWENIYQLDSDPEVMKYLSQFELDHKSDYPKMIERCMAYYQENPGFGLWAAIEKETEEFVGWFMLKKYQYSDDQKIPIFGRPRTRLPTDEKILESRICH